MKYIINENNSPFFNMAFDEYCLENINEEQTFFFLWQNEPTVVIGANQNAYKEVNLEYLESNNIHLVRRITGGGAVFHDFGNVNFTFIGRIEKDENVFNKYIGYIVDALRKMGIQEVAMSGRNDILVAGKKISGCAKRIYKNKCMVHGTLLYDVDKEILLNALNGPKSKLKLRGTDSVPKPVANIKEFVQEIKDVKEFMSVLQGYLIENTSDGNVSKEEIILDRSIVDEIRNNAENKYNRREWIYGKINKSNLCYENKFLCGTIEVEILLSDNVIKEIHFNGDFLGNKAIQELEYLLEGMEYVHSKIKNKLTEIQPSLYLDKITPDELTSLIMGKSF